jgi:putative SOS response-associated peptidase YedK
MLMCGRYSLRTPWQRLAEHFGMRVADVPELFADRYNIAPSQQLLAVRQDAEGTRHPAVLKWGFIPAWSKDGKIAPINAMSETVSDKPMFRTAFRKRRCLLPADGFYEWQRKGSKKQPLHFRLRGGEPFGLAGVWEAWHDPEGEVVETVAILTTDPNELVKPIHTRMPVILPMKDYAEWLNPQMQDADELKTLLRPYPAEEMEAVPVSDYVNNARHEGPECLQEPA